MTITLRDLASVVGSAVDGDAVVADIAYDSSAVTPGSLFFCVVGARADGHRFAEAAVQAGAVALVVERALPVPVPQIIVPSARAAMPAIACAFFGYPSEAMALTGFTGTNGKTTSTYLFASVIGALGEPEGLLGNIERRVGDVIEKGARNTPEAIDLQRFLATMRDAGVVHPVMEVTSEGLVARRVDGTRFACSVFTNLTQDHLNTHGTMDAYFAAKAMLFTPTFSAHAVVNADDPWGRRLLDQITIPVTTFGMDADADVRATSVSLGSRSADVTVLVGGSSLRMHVPLAARYNVSNALAVVAAARVHGFPLEQVLDGIASLSGVPGRVEEIDAGQDFTVLVDYAHTADSLENVLRAAREITPSGARLVVVFGCGGDRDRGKRPEMGRIGATLADRAIITSDNPRTEDPEAIVAAVAAGATGSGFTPVVIVDRRDAIASAIQGARTGDVVVIAGKGHESGQEFGDRTIPFDDRVVAREILGAL